MSLIFADGWLITMNPEREVLENASVCVEKDRIVAVSTRQDLQRRFPGAASANWRRWASWDWAPHASHGQAGCAQATPVQAGSARLGT